MIVVATSTTPAASLSTPSDRAYDLIGTWTCVTAAHASATMTFTRESDGSISMRNVFTTPGGAGEFDEVYRLVPGGYWSWIATQPDRADFKEAATANPWAAEKWFFDGTVTERPHRHDTDTHRIRMIYTRLSDASFEREFELYDSDVWKTTSSSICKRS
jgi:hypothetical protein